MEPSQENKPFWQEEPAHPPLDHTSIKILTLTLYINSAILRLGAFVLSIVLCFKLSPVLGWFMIIFFALAIFRGFRLRKKLKQKRQEVAEIQRIAREKTGATMIGSAVHVAGHPSLGRDQQIVLALTPPNLQIHSYESGMLLASLPFEKILAIHTVVYDDERTPHLEAVDSAAQALQLSIDYGGREMTCLLRSMKKVKPIDWYDGIQKAMVNIN